MPCFRSSCNLETLSDIQNEDIKDRNNEAKELHVFRHLREGPNYVLLKCADATFQCRGTLRLKYKQTKLIRKPCCAENGIDGVGIHFVLNRIYLIEW